MQKDLTTMRHSAAHLLAASVLDIWPNTKLAIGPAIENGFYYDFEFKKPISDSDLPKIEKKMTEILRSWSEFEGKEISVNEAKNIFKNNHFKLELIDEFSKDGKTITTFRSGNFTDLCKGGHVQNPSKEIGPFKLTSIAGAYWKGTEKNPMLTRIYGTVWPTKKELEDYLLQVEEAKKRDHKRLGQELKLFTFLPAAPGMAFWYPNGLSLINSLKEFIRKINDEFGYQEISTPLLAKKEVWETSGHWELFRGDMFAFDIDKQTYALKPMNCPETLLLYKTSRYSYRDLPLKLSDMDPLHRNEPSGTLNGLFRVRELSQDDAHVICTEEQISTVVGEMIDMANKVYKTFGFTPTFYLATKPDKALGDPAIWEKAEKDLEMILKEKKINYGVKEKDGAFYGPKIDLHIDDSLGRNWQLATIQLDFQMPKRFSATFTSSSGKEKTPIMIHRALLGSLERFLGILIEHYGGAFPAWLSPIQAVVIPITNRNDEYAQKLRSRLLDQNLRVQIDTRNETLQSRIRDAQLQKIPFMIVVGDKEQVQQKVSLRSREKGDEGVIDLTGAVSRIKNVND